MCTPTSPPSVAAAEPSSAPSARIADVFRRHALAYRDAHALIPEQARVLAAVCVCRTAELGGFVDVCVACGFTRQVFHSCRDRHCPTCQASAQAEWIAQREERVLPVRHFHVVFTLPSELRPLAQRNGRIVYDAMFAAASETLQSLARSQLGASLGATVVLHTWTREMLYHPHVHCVVTAGGLADDGAWVHTPPHFLFPIAAMRKIFHGVVRKHLFAAHTAGKLDLAGDGAAITEPRAFARFMRGLHRKKWVVYVKAPFAGAEHVFRYLGQYTHRVAISDHRIVAITNDEVTFRTRGSGQISVSSEEFIRRFLLHVLPSGFHKIRHYGLYASGNVNAKLPTARAVLERERPAVPVPDSIDAADKDVVDERSRCPECGERLVVIEIPRGSMKAIVELFLRRPPDTS